MTPVTSLAGTTMSLLGAVQLEPEVWLLKPATLTVAPTRSVPIASVTGCWAAQAGADFHLLGPTSTPP